jgi:hypothetical protein
MSDEMTFAAALSDRYLFGVHVLVDNNAEIDALIKEIPSMVRLGINLVITEVNYNYAFNKHPELRANTVITPEKALALSHTCCDSGIHLVPQFQCLGHQSWDKQIFPLLSVYPEFDETPGQYPDNKGIYCRSWCPQHPGVNPIVFSLIDEIIDAFQAKYIHAGMDEVFLIASNFCPRCRGHDPAQLFAKTVNDIYTHVVEKKACEMLIWGDRLLNSIATEYGEWEASENSTDPAINMIPKQTIICDWHYEQRENYPSIPIFLDKGFRILASGWHDVVATETFLKQALATDNPHMLGYLCTTWGRIKPGEISQFPALLTASKLMSK